MSALFNPYAWAALYVCGVLLASIILGAIGDDLEPEHAGTVLFWPLLLPLILPFALIYGAHKLGKYLAGLE